MLGQICMICTNMDIINLLLLIWIVNQLKVKIKTYLKIDEFAAGQFTLCAVYPLQ